jgi:hypothetical protein
MIKILFTTSNGQEYTGEEIRNVEIIAVVNGLIEWTNNETFGCFDITENFEIQPE